MVNIIEFKYFCHFKLKLKIKIGIALNSYSNISDSNVTFTSLSYGNGPGGILRLRRFNLTNNETEGKG